MPFSHSVDWQFKWLPSELDAHFFAFVATMHLNCDSPNKLLQFRPDHRLPPRGAFVAFSVFSFRTCLYVGVNVCLRVPSVLHQSPTDSQWQLKKFFCKLSQSHPHRWVDLRQLGLSFSRTGGLKGNATPRNWIQCFYPIGSCSRNWGPSGFSVGQIRTTFDIVAFTWSQRNDYSSGASVWTSLCAFGIKRLEDSGNSGTKPPQTSAGK